MQKYFFQEMKLRNTTVFGTFYCGVIIGKLSILSADVFFVMNRHSTIMTANTSIHNMAADYMYYNSSKQKKKKEKHIDMI